MRAIYDSMIEVVPVVKVTFRNNRMITVTPVQPVVCKMCWARPAVNTVRIGATNTEGAPMCQRCTNACITQFSERQEYLDALKKMRGEEGAE